MSPRHLASDLLDLLTRWLALPLDLAEREALIAEMEPVIERHAREERDDAQGTLA